MTDRQMDRTVSPITKLNKADTR